MAKVRKNYWLDSELLSRARELLGTKSETDTVSEALKRVIEGEELVRQLSKGRGAFPGWADPYHEAS